MRKLLKKVLCSVLCLAMLLSCLSIGPLSAMAITMTDYGKNPNPDVDIAVSVPADYPGTFEDFKAELTAALIAQGMDASSFRITDTAVKIDTTNLDGWYVYDHYYNEAAYNAIVPATIKDSNGKSITNPQRAKQPYRVADNTKMTSHGKSGVGTPCLIQDVFVARRWGTPGTKLYPFNQHTYSWETNGRANMCFAGYGTNALTDYMFYPATSDSRRTIEFDLDCAVIDVHTLLGAGFLLNANISSNRLAGYAFYYEWNNATTATAQIRKLQNVDVNFTGSPGTVMTSKSVSLPSGTKLRIRVVLERNRVTVTQRTYSGSAMGDEVMLFDNYPIPVLPAAGNGFGPVVAYKSHGCASMTYFQYGDLAMTYDATAFDALKEVQYVQSAEQKYFVNLVAPESQDTGIPDPSMDSQGYVDGITRMDQNEIFYVSNKDDGRVGTDNDGIGASNTIYTSTETDFIQELAEKIANNYKDDKIYSHVNSPDRVIPLSDFYIIDSTKDETGKINGSQLMTVHQRHLINTNTSVQVSLKDKSRVGNMPTSGTKLTKYEIRLLDPDGNAVELEKGLTTITRVSNADGSVDFPTYTVDKDSKPGRYTFSMLVTDDKGNESGWVSTYFTVFDDSEMPIAIGENTSKNHATIHLTDTGQGIDEDGITFIEDNRGSGVYAYYIAENEDDENNPIQHPDLWVYLDEPVHEYSIDVDLEQYFGQGKKIVVYYMDECRNNGNKAIFKPIHVKVQDDDKNDIDDYYIIGETPVIVLPDDVPEHPDPDFEFSNWEIVPPGDNPPGGGDPITSGKEVTPPDDDEPTIIIKPSYTDHKVNLTYDANATGATIPKADNASTYTTQIVENADLGAKIKAQNVVPVLTGYDFMGWYLDRNCTQEITDQTAATNTTVYAKWEIASYNIVFDHNGGGTSGKTKIENVPYGTKIGLIATAGSQYEVKANETPTKPGYIFQYWTEEKDKPNTRITSSTATTMPAKDLTVYAYYTVDTSKYVIHFDTQGGNRIADKAYPTAATNYGTLQKPVKSGYVFEGWYVQNADGTMSDQKVELSGSNMPSSVAKKEHTLMAKWSPAQDTPYTVSYYYNSGFMNSDGSYKYVKANNMTKTFRAPTESVVTIPEEAMLDGLEGGEFTFSRSYWRNDKENATFDKKNNLDWRTGTVTGGTPLDLRLYYDRYFTVTTQVVSGNGRIWSDDEGFDKETGVLTVKEGTRPTVKWAPEDGWHTANVVLDNRVRDGLLDKSSYKLEEDIHKDYFFRVRFDEGEPSSSPVAKDYYTIATSIEGCYDGSCSITPTGRYIAGRDSVEITWDIDENLYRVDSVQIDQTIYFRSKALMESYKAKNPDSKLNLVADPTFAENDFTRFRRIAQDHKVIVTVDKVPSIGGNATQGFYTVTVNTYGGDEQAASYVPSSQVLKPGEKYNAGPNNTTLAKNDVQNSGSKYHVVSVLIDGVRLAKANGTAFTMDELDKYNFSNYTIKDEAGKNVNIFNQVNANHVIDIFFADPSASDPENWDDTNEENEDQFNKLNTKIVGGPGTISNGGFVYKDDDDRTVSWNIKDGKSQGEPADTTDKNGNTIPNPKYSDYEVDTVTVNKAVVDEDGAPVFVTKLVYDRDGNPVLDKDGNPTYVKDTTKPVVATETITYGTDDTVTITKTELDEDGNPVFETIPVLDKDGKNLLDKDGNPVYFTDMSKPVLKTETVDKKDYENKLDLKVDKDTEVVVNVKPAYRTVTVLKYGYGKTSETKTFFKGQSYSGIFGTPNKTSELVKLVVDGEVVYDYYKLAEESTSLLSDFISLFADETAKDYTVKDVNASGTTLDIPSLDKDHIVEVYFAELDPETEKPKPLPEVTYKVSAKANISDVEFKGQGIVAAGDDAFVSWTLPEDLKDEYQVESVTLNGNEVKDVNSISIPEVNEDQTIVVNFVKINDPTTKVSVKGDPNPKALFKVETEVVGGKGWITTTKSYGAGEDAYVEWDAEYQQVVSSTFYEIAESDREDAAVFGNYINLIGDHYNAEGRIPGQLNYPIDKDGDGVVDLILNWDANGNGVPEYNIVLNGIVFNDDGNVEDYHIDYNYAEITRSTDDDGNEVLTPDTSMCNADGTYNMEHPEGPHGGSHVIDHLDIEVKNEERKFVVKYVIIDGVVWIDRAYDNDTSFPKFDDTTGMATIPAKNYTFEDINANHKVVVVVGTDPATNIAPNVDLDGDGEPDINIDIDGDGIPDVDIDVDGDGVPDLNLDPDNDGEPTGKIDTDKPGDPGYLREDTYVNINYLLPGHQPVFDMDDLGKMDMGDTYDTLPVLLDHLGLTADDVTVDDVLDDDGNLVKSTITINPDKLGNTFEGLDENGNTVTLSLADYEIHSDDRPYGVTDTAYELVTYRFTPKETKVNVEFIQIDGDKNTTTVEIPGRVFDNYTGAVETALVAYINSAEAFGYTQVDPRPDNASGTMTLEPKTIKYYFALKDSIVNVEYVDENGKLLPCNAKVEGGEKYNEAYKVTPEPSIYGYVLDRTALPDNSEGIVSEDKITVTFKYVPKDASVTVKFVNAADGKALINDDTINGKFASEYTAVAEDIPGYVLVSPSDTVKGTFAETQDNAAVVFEYKRAAKVVVKHIDGKGNEIAAEQVTDYLYGDTYETAPVTSENYTYSGAVIGSATGRVDQDTIVVIYLYNEKGATPNIPIDPDDPPVDPVDPDKPTEPTKPTKPTKPTEPTKPTKPTKPAEDINIDIDGDGEPDVNIDIDGDGKPDVNIDTDGDKVPDINIDKDGDGEPDINIDTDGDGNPDVNIDTDGDGEPDINIDTDGDGIADANLDTDNDGVADTNLINPIDTGSTDMYAMYAYGIAAVAALLLVVLLMRKNRREDEAEA